MGEVMRGETQTRTEGRPERYPMTSRMVESWPRVADWFESLWGTDTWRSTFPHSMRIEEFMRDGELVVRAEMPGIDPEKDLDITVDEGMLTITAHREAHAERRHRSEFTYGEFVRSLSLPSGVDSSSIAASYNDGILEVTVRMPSQAPSAQHIPVKRAS